MMTLRASEGVSTEEDGVTQRLRMTEGVSGLAMSVNRPVVLDAADYVRGGAQEFTQDEFQTVISTPLVSKGWVIGALTLGSRKPRSIPQQILNLLASIGQQVGMAVENAHLYQQTERLASGLARLHQAGVLLGSSLDSVTIYHHITEQGAMLLNCQVARLYLWDAEDGVAREISNYGLDGQDLVGTRLLPEENDVLADLIDHRRPVAIKNYATDPRARRYFGERLNIKAELALPLMLHDRLLGFLFLIDQRRPRLWLTEEIDWAESLVSQASFALENAMLYEKAERAAALEERQRIAADIHDGLAQTVGYLGLKADQVAELVAAGKGGTAVEELQRMRDAIGQASQEVRQSIASLQQSPYSHRPLESWLNDIITEFSESSDIAIHWIDRFEDPLLLPPSHVEQVLRVVQEALLNAGRHAQAREILVSLEEEDGRVLVTVADDGVGFDPTVPVEDSRMRFGLSIMRARAARLSGNVEVFSTPGKGTRVVLSWPRTSSTFTMARAK
jgi:signal transduction histidine kinase